MAFQRADERAAYQYMDVMRFCAALAVVFGHAVVLVWGPRSILRHTEGWSWVVGQSVGLGHHAVMAFFVLSGFWVTHAALRQLGSDGFWREFLIDRITRLHIVIVPALALGALLDVFGAGVFGGAAYRGGLGFAGLADGVHNHLTPQLFAGNLLFLQAIVTGTVGTNLPLWSVAFEFWYYVWFAALAISVKRRSLSLALLTLALSAFEPWLLYLFSVWLVGSCLYFADRRSQSAPEVGRAAALRFFGAGVVGAAATLLIFRLGLLETLFADVLFGLAFGLVLWSLLRGAMGFPRWLAPFAHYGASASYSLYVTHYPLFAFGLAAIRHNAWRKPDLGSFGLIIVMTVTAVVAGWLFSRLTEIHTFRLRRAIRLRLRPVARG